jgi:CBS domain containing-hemolysin-like protein
MIDSLELYLNLCGVIIAALIYAVCMAATVALLKSRVRKLRIGEAKKFFACRPAIAVMKQAEMYMVAAQLGLFLAPFVAGFLFFEALTFFPIVIVESSSSIWQKLLSVALLLGVSSIIVILVQLARSMAYARPEYVLRLLAYPALVVGYFFSPCFKFLRWLIKRLLKSFGFKTIIERGLAISAEDFTEILDHSAEAGNIEEEEREMIAGVFHLSDTLIREVMTPRADIVYVNESVQQDELLKEFREHGCSRILVTTSELDDVVGIVLAKDLLFLFDRPDKKFSLNKLIRSVPTISGEKSVDEALREFQRAGTQFSVVLDEHGGVDGIVTFEDIVEEIVGEVFDEHDSPDEELDFQETISGDILVDGSTPITDLNEEYDFSFPEGEYDTIAGFVIHILGRLPKEYEEFEYRGIRIKIEDFNQNRIVQLRIFK